MLDVWTETYDIGDIPSMTVPCEHSLLRHGMLNWYTGEHAAVELGCWLGASTKAMLDGLRAKLEPKGCLNVFDNFVWQDYMNLHSVSTRLQRGDSFLMEFLKNIRYCAVRDCDVVVHCKRLWPMTDLWDEKPIEWLFIDACKTGFVTANVVRCFFPNLVAGALVFEQDFRFCPAQRANIYYIFYRLREHLVPFIRSERGYTVGFRVTEPIPKKVIEAATSSHSSTATASQLREAVDHFVECGALDV